jgi:ribosome-interacting GTPase 1
MPTNLPPEYFDAEKRYKEAKTDQDKIHSLEALISTIPKHKGTDKLRADLRRRLSRLKDKTLTSKRAGKHESSFHIEKEGAGRIAIIGFPNVGKSSLLCSITHATPKVSEYPLTTWIPTPGMMQWENVQIQLIDTPPLNKEHMEPELFDLIRTTDLLLLLVDLQSDPIQQLLDAKEILHEHRIGCCSELDWNIDDYIVTTLPLVLVVNKNDNENFDEDYSVFCELLEEKWPMVTISTQTGRNLEQLKKVIFEELKIIRIYSKPPGKEANLNAPFVIKKGGTVEEFAGKVHKDFLEQLKTARVWGKNVFDGQLVGRDYILQDEDVVELHT